MIDYDLFRDVMARFASGVAVVTTASEGAYHGVTVSSFASLSYSPPLVLFAIDRSLQSHDLIAGSGAYAVNMLARDQSFLAEQFSGQTPLADPRFSRVPHHPGTTGLPLIDGCLAWVECRPWARYDGGDHSIFVGEIEALALGVADDPLIYYNRGFAELAWS